MSPRLSGFILVLSSIVNRNPHMQILAAARVFDGADFHADHALVLQDGRIADLVPRAQLAPAIAPPAPAPGSLLAPGFIDVQVNGGGGALLNAVPDVPCVARIAAAHRRFGTTGLLPTLITDDVAKLEALADAAADAMAVPGVLGFHLEGPFLSAARPGVHPKNHIRAPDARSRAALLRFARHGRSLATLAPETVPEGFVAELVAAGLRVAAGHTAADSDALARAADEGLTGVTHLFNAMLPVSARAPGVPGRAFDDPRLTAGIICDGLHVDPLVLRMAFRLMGPDRLMLVTDAMPSVGCDLAEFDLSGLRVRLVGGKLTAPDGTLAGAHLDMAQAVRNAVTMMRAPLGDALAMASRVPARFLGLDGIRGRLARGFAADIVELDANLVATATWIAGGRA
jgi:N-acetylglucosamine-6-phosphate deacetylase